MEKITLFKRKKTGQIVLRFRLRDTRLVELYYQTGIKVDAHELDKFDIDGKPRPRVTKYDSNLKRVIEHYMSEIGKAYRHLCQTYHKSNITSTLLTQAVAQRISQNPIPTKQEYISAPLQKNEVPFIPDSEGYGSDKRPINYTETVSYQFRGFAEALFQDGSLSEKRYNLYIYTSGCLNRFLTINKLDNITAAEFSPELLGKFKDFLINEFKYVNQYPELFYQLAPNAVPTKPREANTASQRMKMVKAFFNNLVEKELLEKNPFDRVTRKVKTALLREDHNNPVYLRKDELITLINAQVPENLQETKDAFVVQCAFGCRISDFAKLTMESIKVTPEGIPYIHYLPQKTQKALTEEIETPIMHYAFEIILRKSFRFPITLNVSGATGYNKKIKLLLKHCGISREVKVYNHATKTTEFYPLYELASSKLARSTNVDIQSKVTIDPYAAGLHSRGSNAVHHYTNSEIIDKFHRMCITFGQPLYEVSKDLKIIKEPYYLKGFNLDEE